MACDGSTYTPSCDAAGNPRYCDDGFVRQGANCAALGLDCIGGKCAGRGNACTNSIFSQPETIELEGTACSGSTLTACVSGRLATLDCATLGPNFTCQTLGGEFFCGLSNECVPASNYARSTTLGPTCNGSNITFCNAGRVESIDCRTLGFTRCEVNTSIEHYGCL